MAKSAPTAASTAVTVSTTDDSATSTSDEAPVDAAHIIVDENAQSPRNVLIKFDPGVQIWPARFFAG
jgi:hypothetical protein